MKDFTADNFNKPIRHLVEGILMIPQIYIADCVLLEQWIYFEHYYLFLPFHPSGILPLSLLHFSTCFCAYFFFNNIALSKRGMPHSQG